MMEGHGERRYPCLIPVLIPVLTKSFIIEYDVGYKFVCFCCCSRSYSEKFFFIRPLSFVLSLPTVLLGE